MRYQDYVPALFFYLQPKYSSTDIIFIHGLFCSKWIFSQTTFPDFVKFKDISMIGKIHLLFSSKCGNPDIDVF